MDVVVFVLQLIAHTDAVERFGQQRFRGIEQVLGVQLAVHHVMDSALGPDAREERKAFGNIDAVDVADRVAQVVLGFAGGAGSRRNRRQRVVSQIAQGPLHSCKRAVLIKPVTLTRGGIAVLKEAGSIGAGEPLDVAHGANERQPSSAQVAEVAHSRLPGAAVAIKGLQELVEAGQAS